ncbi:MAG: regulatory subunit-like protein [Myxococcaceae bacterium]|nr:regulatory subunit-like protein [Myxococcaceae bacterium]
MSDAVRAHKDKGTQLLARGKLPAALAEFQKVVASVPSDLGARQKVAEIFAKLGKKPEAIAEYAQVVGRYADLGQFFKASALCKVILTLDPKHVGTQQSLAKLYAGRRPSEAPQVTKRVPLAGARAPDPLEVGALLGKEPVVAQPEIEIDIPIELEEIPIEVEAPKPAVTLPVIPLFSDLSRDEFVHVLNVIEPRAFYDGEAIVVEGDAGHAMYAIAEGKVSVVRTIDGQPARRVAQMNEGDFFGEMALLSDSPRLATVVADGPVIVLEFARAALEKLTSLHPKVGEAIERFYRDRLLANLLRSSPLLHPLSEEQKQSVAVQFQPRMYPSGDAIIEEGQPGESVFLLLRGSCQVFHRDEARGKVRYPNLREGDSFGEISVVLNRPASATVEAAGPVVVLWLPAEVFREQVLSHAEVKPMVMRLVNERLERTAELVSRQQAEANDLRI